MKTANRQPVGKALSYPLGLADLKRGLESLPQAGQIVVTFSAWPGRSASQFRGSIKREDPSVVLSAEYVKWDKAVSLGDRDSWVTEYLRGKWVLHVYPVARHRRAQARKALVESGIPAVAAWLGSARPESWYHGRKSIEVRFDPLERSVCWQERADAV